MHGSLLVHGHGLSSFRDLAPFCLPSKTAFRPWTIVHGGQKIEASCSAHAVMLTCTYSS